MENIILACKKKQLKKYKNKNEWEYFYKIENILHFANYYNYDIVKVSDNYLEAIKYRDSLFRLTHNCEKCIMNKMSHSIEIVNNSNILITPAKALDKDPYYICKHLSIIIDKITNRSDFSGSINIIIDYEDYSLVDMVADIHVPKEIIKMIRICYPCIFSKYILKNTPYCVSPIIDALKTCMDNTMINKLEII